MYQKHSLEEIIEISKQNPKKIYEGDLGEVVCGGKVFKNKKQFEEALVLMKFQSLHPKTFKFISKIFKFIAQNKKPKL